jgi:hypothetical protein
MQIQTIEKIKTLAVPAIWKKTAGLWRGRTLKDPVAYQKRLRRQWEKRLDKLV